MVEVSTTTISTQGHFGEVPENSDRIVAIATQGHFMSIWGILSMTIYISRRDGGITITKDSKSIIN